ncbi:hypothetical protein ACTG1T_14840 [Aeromonas veronii]|nr:hypothetical protein [Aeromonas veronii]MCF5889546.1 hypothetical protein [Aeromonas veronii]MCX9132223.1 hypothetical protein [Aeromonas veronii]
MKRSGLPPPPLIQRHLSSNATAPAHRHANAMIPTPVQQEQIRRAN